MLPYPKMPTKQVSYRNDKAVFVRVYVEKPKKKTSSSSIQHQHHQHLHYHVHHTVRQEVVHGYNRREGLLKYSHLLRESKREGESSTPLLSKWFPNNNHQPETQITPSTKKSKYPESAGCFGSWKILMPSFLKSWSNAQKKEEKNKVRGGFLGKEMKKLQVKRGKRFIRNIFATTRK